MIFFDAIAWIIIANIAVYLAEDLSSAIRGKRSPRRQARDERRKEGVTTPADRSRSAIGGYLSGLLEDATVAAKKSRRVRAAKRQGKKAIGGVFVDFDHDTSRYYADCDICGWVSQPYRIEENAKNVGAEHAKIHDSSEDPEDASEDSGWVPRVIDGGKEEPGFPKMMDPVIHDDDTYKLKPSNDMNLFGWVCNKCGEGQENYTSRQAAELEANSHTCDTNNDPNAKIEKEGKVNFEGTGATAIQDAIGDTASELHDRYEEFDSIAATLADAADNYESRGMADSTVTLIREAADAATSAATQIQTAAEHMDSALADFQATDGKVAEAAQEAGNVADESILLD